MTQALHYSVWQCWSVHNKSFNNNYISVRKTRKKKRKEVKREKKRRKKEESSKKK